MIRPFTILPLIALLAATPGFAQEAAEGAGEAAPTEEAPAEGAEQGDTNIGGGLDLGQQDAAAQAGPKTYVKETFDSWSLQCLDVPDDQGEDVCQMYQLLKEPGGASVAEVSIFQLQNGGRAVAGGTFVVPLETLLTEKLRITVDGGQARTYDYSFCAPVGCYARVGFTAEDIQRFKAGAAAQVTLVPALAPDQTVTIEMSLKGFTAAFEATSALRQ